MNNETIVIYCADMRFSWVESFLQHWTITYMLFESWLREDTREFTASVQRIGMLCLQKRRNVTNTGTSSSPKYLRPMQMTTTVHFVT